MNSKHSEELSGTKIINIYSPSTPEIRTDFTISNESPQIRSEWIVGEGTTTVMEVQSGYRRVNYDLVYDLVHEIAQRRKNALKELAKY